MNFTVNTVSASLAAYLAPLFPLVAFYQDPNQQGTEPPCMFLQQRYSNIRQETGGFFLRTIGFDLTYLVDYHLPDLQRLYQSAAEILDIAMETFPYTDGETKPPVMVRTHQREWRIDLDALHYKFELQERVSIPKDFPTMQTIAEYNEGVR